MSERYRVTDAASGRVLVPSVRRAGSFSERLFGLIGRSADAGETGIWLQPCNGIHTFGMRFPIDVVLLDRENRVLEVRLRIRPFRLIMPCLGVASTLELPAGAARGFDTDIQVEFQALDRES